MQMHCAIARSMMLRLGTLQPQCLELVGAIPQLYTKLDFVMSLVSATRNFLSVIGCDPLAPFRSRGGQGRLEVLTTDGGC